MAQRVGFVVAGAQKAGTSALHRYLSHHPELFLPSQKELHFFDDESLGWSAAGAAGQDAYQRYHSLFKDAPVGSVWGEATPIYMYWWPSIARMWHYNPDMKLILVLRNPITRAFSHWNMERQRGAEPLGFLQALQQEQDRCRGARPLQHREFSYTSRGFYCEQLRRIWHFFPRHQTLVLKHDDLLRQPAPCLEKVHGHLGVNAQPFVGEEREHTLPYETTMGKGAYNWLRQLFEAEVRQLEGMLDWDCSDWLHA